jgi:hypothetical protein
MSREESRNSRISLHVVFISNMSSHQIHHYHFRRSLNVIDLRKRERLSCWAVWTQHRSLPTYLVLVRRDSEVLRRVLTDRVVVEPHQAGMIPKVGVEMLRRHLQAEAKDAGQCLGQVCGEVHVNNQESQREFSHFPWHRLAAPSTDNVHISLFRVGVSPRGCYPAVQRCPNF